MPMDPVLKGVVPVNSSQKVASLTTKKDAADRHSAPSKTHKKDATKSRTFGYISIERDLIESQLILGLGQYHPNNVDKIPTEQLLEEAHLLTDRLGPEPSVPTPKEIFGAVPKSPNTFYQLLPKQTSHYDGINQVRLPFALRADAKDNKTLHGATDETAQVSLETLPNKIWLNIAVDKTFNRNKATAYIQYFQYLIDNISEHIEEGIAYNTRHIDWHLKQSLQQQAVQLAKEQSSWDAALTASDQREIQRQIIYEQREQQLETLIADQVKLQLTQALATKKPRAKRTPINQGTDQ